MRVPLPGTEINLMPQFSSTQTLRQEAVSECLDKVINGSGLHTPGHLTHPSCVFQPVVRGAAGKSGTILAENCLSHWCFTRTLTVSHETIRQKGLPADVFTELLMINNFLASCVCWSVSRCNSKVVCISGSQYVWLWEPLTDKPRPKSWTIFNTLIVFNEKLMQFEPYIVQKITADQFGQLHSFTSLKKTLKFLSSFILNTSK